MSTARQIRLLLITAFCSVFLFGQTAHIATKVSQALATVAPVPAPNQAKAHMASPEKQQLGVASKRSAPLPPFELPAAFLLGFPGSGLYRDSAMRLTTRFLDRLRFSLQIAPQHPRFALRL